MSKNVTIKRFNGTSIKIPDADSIDIHMDKYNFSIKLDPVNMKKIGDVFKKGG